MPLTEEEIHHQQQDGAQDGHARNGIGLAQLEVGPCGNYSGKHRAIGPEERVIETHQFHDADCQYIQKCQYQNFNRSFHTFQAIFR